VRVPSRSLAWSLTNLSSVNARRSSWCFGSDGSGRVRFRRSGDRSDDGYAGAY
jgi:hypothetical protein